MASAATGETPAVKEELILCLLGTSLAEVAEGQAGDREVLAVVIPAGQFSV